MRRREPRHRKILAGALDNAKGPSRTSLLENKREKKILEASEGIEPPYKDLQSSA